MEKFSQMRQALEASAAFWRSRLDAFEVQLALGRAEAADRVEAAKKQLGEALAALEDEARRGRSLAQQAQEDIRARIAEAQVQLALGRAETRDALEAQQARIRDAMAKVEQQVDAAAGAAGEAWEDASRRVVDAAARLEVEREALQVRLELEARRGAAALDEARRVYAERAAAARTAMEKMERETGARLAAFQKDVRAAWDDLGRAFRDLLG